MLDRARDLLLLALLFTFGLIALDAGWLVIAAACTLGTACGLVGWSMGFL